MNKGTYLTLSNSTMRATRSETPGKLVRLRPTTSNDISTSMLALLLLPSQPSCTPYTSDTRRGIGTYVRTPPSVSSTNKHCPTTTTPKPPPYKVKPPNMPLSSFPRHTILRRAYKEQTHRPTLFPIIVVLSLTLI